MPFSLSQILSAARATPTLLGPESAGFLILSVLENTGLQPLRLDARCIILAGNGAVHASAPQETTPEDADRRLRQLLQQALCCSGSRHRALLQVAAALPRGLSQLRDEVMTAMVPLNRGAARRALTRLHRRLEEAGSDIESSASEASWLTETTDEVTAPGPPTFDAFPVPDEPTEPMVPATCAPASSPPPDAISELETLVSDSGMGRREGLRSLARFRARPSDVGQLLDEFTNETYGSTLEVQHELRRVAALPNELSRTPPPVAEAPERPSAKRRRNPKQALLAGLMTIGAVAFFAGLRQGQRPQSLALDDAPAACSGTVVVQTRPLAEVHLIEARRTTAAAGPSARFEAVSCDAAAEVVVRLEPSAQGSWIRLPLAQQRLHRASASGEPLVLSVFEEQREAP